MAFMSFSASLAARRHSIHHSQRQCDGVCCVPNVSAATPPREPNGDTPPRKPRRHFLPLSLSDSDIWKRSIVERHAEVVKTLRSKSIIDHGSSTKNGLRPPHGERAHPPLSSALSRNSPRPANPQSLWRTHSERTNAEQEEHDAVVAATPRGSTFADEIVGLRKWLRLNNQLLAGDDYNAVPLAEKTRKAPPKSLALAESRQNSYTSPKTPSPQQSTLARLLKMPYARAATLGNSGDAPTTNAENRTEDALRHNPRKGKSSQPSESFQRGKHKALAGRQKPVKPITLSERDSVLMTASRTAPPSPTLEAWQQQRHLTIIAYGQQQSEVSSNNTTNKTIKRQQFFGGGLTTMRQDRVNDAAGGVPQKRVTTAPSLRLSSTEHSQARDEQTDDVLTPVAGRAELRRCHTSPSSGRQEAADESGCGAGIRRPLCHKSDRRDSCVSNVSAPLPQQRGKKGGGGVGGMLMRGAAAISPLKLGASVRRRYQRQRNAVESGLTDVGGAVAPTVQLNAVHRKRLSIPCVTPPQPSPPIVFAASSSRILLAASSGNFYIGSMNANRLSPTVIVDRSSPFHFPTDTTTLPTTTTKPAKPMRVNLLRKSASAPRRLEQLRSDGERQPQDGENIKDGADSSEEGAVNVRTRIDAFENRTNC